MVLEWDARKAVANLKKHRVAFEDAGTVFQDTLAITFPDPDHSLEEPFPGGTERDYDWPYNKRARGVCCALSACGTDSNY